MSVLSALMLLTDALNFKNSLTSSLACLHPPALHPTHPRQYIELSLGGATTNIGHNRGRCGCSISTRMRWRQPSDSWRSHLTEIGKIKALWCFDVGLFLLASERDVAAPPARGHCCSWQQQSLEYLGSGSALTWQASLFGHLTVHNWFVYSLLMRSPALSGHIGLR